MGVRTLRLRVRGSLSCACSQDQKPLLGLPVFMWVLPCWFPAPMRSGWARPGGGGKPGKLTCGLLFAILLFPAHLPLFTSQSP